MVWNLTTWIVCPKPQIGLLISRYTVSIADGLIAPQFFWFDRTLHRIGFNTAQMMFKR
jgi:hypothetical protein